MNKINSDFHSITSASVEKFLYNNGWQKDVTFPNKKLLVFLKDQESLAIPASEKFADFYARLKDIVETLSYILDKTENQIIKSMLTTNVDRLEFRIISNLSEGGRLPLAYATQCVEGLKELVLFSACAEERAQPICSRYSKSAAQYLDSFKLAQTEVGSYVFNIDAQVIDEGFDEMALVPEIAVPVERKIVERISTAINQVDGVVNRNEKIDALIESAYEKGITANMCDALLKLHPDNTDTEVCTSFYYASSIKKNDNQIESVKLSNMHFYVINDIAKRYRDNTLIEDVTLVGKVVILKRQMEGTIHFSTEIHGSQRRITIPLSEEDYRTACDAHRDDKQVLVRGILDKSERSWIITDLLELKIIN